MEELLNMYTSEQYNIEIEEIVERTVAKKPKPVHVVQHKEAV